MGAPATFSRVHLPNLVTPVKIMAMALTQGFSRRLAIVLLIIILLIAAGLRFYNINWDNGIFAHPDERSTVAFYAPTIRWPQDISTLLDPRQSPLNPFWDVARQERRSYTYGHFPLYALALTANFLDDLAPLSTQLPVNLPPEIIQFLATSTTGHGFARIGRFLMGLADLFTVYLLFLLGRRLYGLWGGVLAAAFSAFTVLQIQLAHFFAVDPVSTTFTLLALYGSILLYDRKSAGAAIVAGVGVALAVASKFSALPVAFLPIAAGYLAIRHQNKISDPQIPNPKSQIQNHIIGLVILSLAVAFALFVVTSPFVLLDFGNFRRAVLDEQGNMVSGLADFPFTRQYRHTTAYWYFIEQQLRWGMGWALGLLGLAGAIWVALKTIRGQAQVGELLALLWIVLYFGPTGLFLAKFMRYMSPVVPLLSLFGAGLVAALWQLGNRKNTVPSPAWATGEAASRETPLGPIPTTTSTSPPPLRPPAPLRRNLPKLLALSLAAFALSGAIFWSLAFVNGVYGTDHTWVTFARWVYANVPHGSCIAWEHWDDRMPTDLPEPNGNPGARGYYQPQLPMYDEDTQQKYEYLRNTLMNCDYIALASNRLWRTIPGLPERYPMSARYYRALFSGELGFEPVYSVETPPQLGPFIIDDQPADESFTVYDHPKPILFKKTRQLAAQEWDDILGGTWQSAIPGYVGSPTLLMRLRGATNHTPSAPLPDEAAGKSLLLDSPVEQLPAINDYRWNDVANNSPLAATLLWWLAVMLIGVISFPVTFLLFGKLPDRGYGLSKSLGLLLVSYFVWLNASLVGQGWLGNTLITAILALLLFVAASTVIIWTHWRALFDFLRRQTWLIVAVELLFSLIFILFVYLRLLNPDLWHPWLGGEKMLEIGFLNAVVKSAQMPPYDPFFAGGVINYYYYGLFLVGVLIKLTGIQPAIAFNLAVPTLAALTAINAFSLAGNLAILSQFDTKPSRGKIIVSGLLAVLFIIFLGNLEGAAQFMRNLADLSLASFDSAIPGLATLVLALDGFAQALTGSPIAAYNYWDPTRVIPETINEFPYFSFLFADLHPHMIGIPFTLLFLSLAFNWLLPTSDEGQRTTNNEQRAIHNSQFIIQWLSIPFVLGAIAVINTWDLPTYLGVMVAAVLLKQYRQILGPLTLRRGVILLVIGGLFALALLVATYLLYLPFFANYQPPAETGVGLVYTKTPLDQHLKIWGFFLFIIVSWLGVSLLHVNSRNSLLRSLSLFLRRWSVLPHLWEIYKAVVRRQTDMYQLGLWALGLTLALAAILFLLGYRVPAYLLPLTLIAALLLFRKEMPAAPAYLGLLTFTGLLVLLGVEFFFLRDFLGGGPYFRMNTLFKFFIQVWVMFGLVTAVTLPQIWEWAYHWRLPAQFVWRGAAMMLLLAGLVYPVLGTRTRVDDRFPGPGNRPAIGTLDGLAYMTVGAFEWPAGNPIELNYDYEAIRWLQQNVTGTPVIAEAKIGYYREGGMRVAAYTGLPSVLGGLHQNEQRPGSQIAGRDWLVNEFWNTPDPERARQLMAELDISYVYVGQLERATYGPHVGDKFEQLRRQGALELMYENEKTQIYKVKREAR